MATLTTAELQANRERMNEIRGRVETYAQLDPMDYMLISKYLDDVTYLLGEVERLREALRIIKGWTCNPRKYEPSISSIHHVCSQALEGQEA
ncbi:MAG: hypothetical protein K6T83_08175 [Alicyclobacillus sp.]|nr:hypothetical protein [Alicyclobacillus sp.]